MHDHETNKAPGSGLQANNSGMTADDRPVTKEKK
jgi:hypothetical protein